MKKKLLGAILLVVFLLGEIMSLANAQQDEYRLNLNRTFGYSSGSQIRGTFSMEVIGPQNIKSITYLIDGNVIELVTSNPFRISFQTSKYGYGWHELSALVETIDGKKVTTPVRKFEFATSDQEASAVTSIIFPLLGGVLVVMMVGMGFQVFVLKNRPASTIPLGAPRKFGINGGSVCPQCQRAFSLHWWAPNLGFRTKFDRCDFCGKWSIVKVLNGTELIAAQTAELQQIQPAPATLEKSEEDRFKEMIEKSRYTN